MNAALRELMGGLVDYAGLFPPAALEMAAAAGKYADHRAGDPAWMLGSFILPALRLSELGTVRAGLGSTDPWPLSLLIGGGDPAGLSATLTGQLQAMDDYSQRFPADKVAALEAPLPAGLVPGDLTAYLTLLTDTLARGGWGGTRLYLEVPATTDPDHDRSYLTALASWREASPANGFSGLGAKLRCGGVTAEAFPSVQRIASFIQLTATLGLDLKFTAGLHHPVRQQAIQPVVMMHGFLNVFVAALLARVDNAGLTDLVAVVGETNPAGFRLEGEDLVWGRHRFSPPQIRAQRRTALPGFGSCSFSEPRADLISLDLL